MSAVNELPSKNYLDSRLNYNPLTGDLTWRPKDKSDFGSGPEWYYKVWNSKNAGKIAGHTAQIRRGKSTYWYITIRIDGVAFKASRVIWKMMTGYDPVIIDHKNQNSLDNRWENLRDTSIEANNQNASRRWDNISGVTGVSWRPELGKWRVRVNIKGQTKNLGVFGDYTEAVEAVLSARSKYGYSVNHGS